MKLFPLPRSFTYNVIVSFSRRVKTRLIYIYKCTSSPTAEYRLCECCSHKEPNHAIVYHYAINCLDVSLPSGVLRPVCHYCGNLRRSVYRVRGTLQL